MKLREVLLVIVLILAGLVLYQFKTGRWNFDWDWGWDGDFGVAREEVAAEETRTIEAPLPPAIEIENGHGWIEVRGGDQDFAQLTFKKVVWHRKAEEARAIAGQIKYTLATEADRLRLATNRDEFRRKPFETGFILTVPRGLAVRVVNGYGAVRIEGVKEATVRNRHGEVYVSDVDGPAELETSYEDAEVRNVRGPCRITNRHADVRASSVTGDLFAETSYARIQVADAGGRAELRGPNSDIEARRVAGAVKVDASYEKVLLDDVGPAEVTGHNMALTAEDVRGDLEVRTSYESVEAAGVQGRLVVDGRNTAVTARGIGGPLISVRTSYENVSLADFSAEVGVVCKNGNVTVAPRDLRMGVDVRAEHGTIEFLWPSGEKARLEARSRGGAISWGLAGAPDVNETNGIALVKAFSDLVSAPLVYLSTEYDDIRIQEGGRRF
jgi:DUF4097 and DUF4098 domain-containing protein YvlB